MRSQLVAAFGCLVLAMPLSLPVHAAPAGQGATVWVAQRVTPAADHVVLEAKFSFGHAPGVAAFASLRRSGRQLLAMEGFAADTPGTSGAHVYADGSDNGCPPTSACDLLAGPGATEFIVNYPAGVPQPDVIYLTVRGEEVTVSLLGSPGWRVRRTRLAAHFVDAGTDNAGAEAIGETVEHFTSAGSRGYSTGSLAIGTPPCRPAHRVGQVREGTGTAQLTGGDRAAGFDCRSSVLDAVAASRGSTTWSFTGDVTGMARGGTRLTVIQRDPAL